MKKFIGFLFVILIGLGIFAWVKWAAPKLAEKKQMKTSGVDASKMETFTWGGDGYAGYYVLNSTEMRRRLAMKGVILKFVNDGGAYADRLEKFSKGEYDFILLPISSFIQHGKKYSYRLGTIPAAISDSKGADCLEAFPEFKFSKVNDLDNPNIKIIYTGASPTEDIINLTISTFDLNNLQESSSWKVEVNSSEEVFELAKKAAKDNTVDKSNIVYGMWEPEVSKAEEQLGMVKIWGSENFSNYIVDVFVFSNKSMSVRSEKVTEILRTYFDVVDYYNARQDEQVKELKKLTGLKQPAVEKLINNIHWYTLYQNAHDEFGIPTNAGDQANEGLIRTIYAWNDINRMLKLEGEVENPYTILNKKILENLLASSLKPVISATSTAPTDFSPLDEKGWERLSETGILKVENITFQASVNKVDELGEEVIGKVSEKLLQNYPDYRILIAGHTGIGENEEENIKLSQERADAVRQILIAVYNINPNRILAKGFGSSRSPQRKINESERAFRSRMARVEFILMQ